MDLHELRAERNFHAGQMRQLLDRAGDRWTPENQATYARHEKAIERLDERIVRQQRALDEERERGVGGLSIIGGSDLEYREAFRSWLRRGDTPGPGADLLNERWRRVSAEIPLANGGAVAPVEFGGRVIESMATMGGVRAVAEVLRTDNGRAITFPTTDTRNEKGYRVTREEPDPEDAPVTWGQKVVDGFLYSSGLIPVPMDLVVDAGIDLEEYLARRGSRRIFAATEEDFIKGSGEDEPEGLLEVTEEGAVAGSPGFLEWGDILDLIHSVDPIHRVNGSLMLHDDTFRHLKEVADVSDRPLWLPGVNGESDRLGGYPFILNPHMPSFEAGTKPILFGDFKNYMVRDSRLAVVVRLEDSSLLRAGKMGFEIFSRHDGKLLDVGGAIKHLAMS